jgi:ABC-type branched-subunit amino acid transport system ATPase component
MTLLKVEGLTKNFGELCAVNRCSFEVAPCAIQGLIGPNGSGKTTVFNLITGFLKVTSGKVLFRDQEITGWPPHQVSRAGIARTFQLVRIFRRMTVLENLLEAPKDQVGERIFPGAVGLPAVRRQEREHLARAWDLLSVVGLDKYANEYCGNLPYAEQKMVELTRALMGEPDLILLDEPTSGINPTLVNQILDYIRRLRAERGMTFLVVEHDMRVIMNLCDRIVVLNYGEKIAEGTPAEISRDRGVIDAYLGV